MSIGETSVTPCGRPDPGIGRRAIIGLRAVVTLDGQGLIARTAGQSGGDLEMRLDRTAAAGAVVEAKGTLQGVAVILGPLS